MNQWVGGVEKELWEFLDLPVNWDSYGARRIDLEAVQVGIWVLSNYVPPDSPAPHVVPTSRGGIQIEWHTQGVDLEIEVLSADSLQVFYENQTEQAEEEFEFHSPFTDLPKLLAEKLPHRIF
jgi:hypothetical protein